MPHHRRARDDRHSYAPASRFLTDEVLGTTEVIETARPGAPGAAALETVRVPAPVLDALFE
jgi:DNA helicase-2/ATP-dependent DNA helicase PcrA